MTKKEIKIKALWKIWHWVFHLYEGYPEKLSDTLNDEIDLEMLTEKEAKLIQKEIYLEGERIVERIKKLEGNNNLKNKK